MVSAKRKRLAQLTFCGANAILWSTLMVTQPWKEWKKSQPTEEVTNKNVIELGKTITDLKIKIVDTDSTAEEAVEKIKKLEQKITPPPSVAPSPSGTPKPTPPPSTSPILTTEEKEKYSTALVVYERARLDSEKLQKELEKAKRKREKELELILRKKPLEQIDLLFKTTLEQQQELQKKITDLQTQQKSDSQNLETKIDNERKIQVLTDSAEKLKEQEQQILNRFPVCTAFEKQEFLNATKTALEEAISKTDASIAQRTTELTRLQTEINNGQKQLENDVGKYLRWIELQKNRRNQFKRFLKNVVKQNENQEKIIEALQSSMNKEAFLQELQNRYGKIDENAKKLETKIATNQQLIQVSGSTPEMLRQMDQDQRALLKLQFRKEQLKRKEAKAVAIVAPSPSVAPPPPTPTPPPSPSPPPQIAIVLWETLELIRKIEEISLKVETARQEELLRIAREKKQAEEEAQRVQEAAERGVPDEETLKARRLEREMRKKMLQNELAEKQRKMLEEYKAQAQIALFTYGSFLPMSYPDQRPDTVGSALVPIERSWSVSQPFSSQIEIQQRAESVGDYMIAVSNRRTLQNILIDSMKAEQTRLAAEAQRLEEVMKKSQDNTDILKMEQIRIFYEVKKYRGDITDAKEVQRREELRALRKEKERRRREEEEARERRRREEEEARRKEEEKRYRETTAIPQLQAETATFENRILTPFELSEFYSSTAVSDLDVKTWDEFSAEVQERLSNWSKIVKVLIIATIIIIVVFLIHNEILNQVGRAFDNDFGNEIPVVHGSSFGEKLWNLMYIALFIVMIKSWESNYSFLDVYVIGTTAWGKHPFLDPSLYGPSPSGIGPPFPIPDPRPKVIDYVVISVVLITVCGLVVANIVGFAREYITTGLILTLLKLVGIGSLAFAGKMGYDWYSLTGMENQVRAPIIELDDKIPVYDWIAKEMEFWKKVIVTQESKITLGTTKVYEVEYAVDSFLATDFQTNLMLIKAPVFALVEKLDELPWNFELRKLALDELSKSVDEVKKKMNTDLDRFFQPGEFKLAQMWSSLTENVNALLEKLKKPALDTILSESPDLNIEDPELYTLVLENRQGVKLFFYTLFSAGAQSRTLEERKSDIEKCRNILQSTQAKLETYQRELREKEEITQPPTPSVGEALSQFKTQMANVFTANMYPIGLFTIGLVFLIIILRFQENRQEQGLTLLVLITLPVLIFLGFYGMTYWDAKRLERRLQSMNDEIALYEWFNDLSDKLLKVEKIQKSIEKNVQSMSYLEFLMITKPAVLELKKASSSLKEKLQNLTNNPLERTKALNELSKNFYEASKLFSPLTSRVDIQTLRGWKTVVERVDAVLNQMGKPTLFDYFSNVDVMDMKQNKEALKIATLTISGLRVLTETPMQTSEVLRDVQSLVEPLEIKVGLRQPPSPNTFWPKVKEWIGFALSKLLTPKGILYSLFVIFLLWIIWKEWTETGFEEPLLTRENVLEGEIARLQAQIQNLEKRPESYEAWAVGEDLSRRRPESYEGEIARLQAQVASMVPQTQLEQLRINLADAQRELQQVKRQKPQVQQGRPGSYERMQKQIDELNAELLKLDPSRAAVEPPIPPPPPGGPPALEDATAVAQKKQKWQEELKLQEEEAKRQKEAELQDKIEKALKALSVRMLNRGYLPTEADKAKTIAEVMEGTRGNVQDELKDVILQRKTENERKAQERAQKFRAEQEARERQKREEAERAKAALFAGVKLKPIK